ncbi:MAG: hypothetical protein Q9187_004451 [Circinaria calcarea]
MALTHSGQMPKMLWQHPQPETTNIYQFKQAVARKRGIDLPTFQALFDYSINSPASFWADAWSDFPIVHSGKPNLIVDESARIDSLPRWFPGVTLNYAENILYTASPQSPSTRSTLHKEDSRVAIVEVREGLSSTRELTWGQLRARAAVFASAFRRHGVKRGDRVAVVAGNSLDTLCVFLGVTSLGGLFSSSSCDMGTAGILERLKQIKPKWLFVDEVAVYNGKTTDLRAKMEELTEGMRGIAEFEGVVSVPRLMDQPRDMEGIKGVRSLDTFLEGEEEGKMEFERVGFQDGFLIVYSSGTTGPPKCIVHGTGSILLGAWKEGHFHREMGKDSVALQYTTTGWIMYLASIQTLLFGAKLVMYDGSPFYPRVDVFLQLVEQQKYIRDYPSQTTSAEHTTRVTHFGISPRYLRILQAASVVPKEAADLSSLKLVTSTGMVLPPALFSYFYSPVGFPPRTHLANIYGGTDIAGAFLDCNALDPVYETGGCQGRSLGMDVRVYDPDIGEGEVGREVEAGKEGELVAVKPFPNMPISFWGDDTGEKYYSAYFSRFDSTFPPFKYPLHLATFCLPSLSANPFLTKLIPVPTIDVWTQGDLISIHPPTNSLILHGRADGVLNPSGVRFGSAEIYAVIDTHFGNEIEDSVCVGQRRKQDTDVS